MDWAERHQYEMALKSAEEEVRKKAEQLEDYRKGKHLKVEDDGMWGPSTQAAEEVVAPEIKPAVRKPLGRGEVLFGGLAAGTVLGAVAYKLLSDKFRSEREQSELDPPAAAEQPDIPSAELSPMPSQPVALEKVVLPMMEKPQKKKKPARRRRNSAPRTRKRRKRS